MPPTDPSADIPAPGTLDAISYRTLIDRVSRWGQDYLESLQERPVISPIAPGDTLAKLPAHPPETGLGLTGSECMVDDLRTVLEPGLVHWQHPGFFGYFSCNASTPGIAAELAAATLNTNGMLWSTSPSATELETRMLDWCAELFGLPEFFRFDADQGGGGVIQSTASEATLAAMVAARSRVVRAGANRNDVTVYTSTQAHSSVVKAAMVAGLADHPEDRSRVRLIAPDAGLAMNPENLRTAIERDLRDGLTPALVVATLGTTSTGAFDPLHGIAGVIESSESDPWLHVDAAWAGAAMVCPELRSFGAGLERADSLCVNPHKWMLTNFDCDLFWVRRADDLTASMSITPAYLRNAPSDEGSVIDYRDWHVPLGRRARAIKLWWVIRYFGVDGLRAHIRGHLAMAERIERWLRDDPRFEVCFERSLALICFRLSADSVDAEPATPELVRRVNERGVVLMTPTVVPLSAGAPPSPIARISVGTTLTDNDAVDRLLEELSAVADELRPGAGTEGVE